MKGYVEASKFPITEVAGRKIPRVVLGQHPYDGITYTSRARDEEYLRRWTGPRSMAEMMKPIMQRFGLTASRDVPSDRAVSGWHREALKLTMEETGVEIALVLGTGLLFRKEVDATPYLNRLCYKLAGDSFLRTWRKDPIVHYGLVDREGRTRDDVEKFLEKSISLRGPPSKLKGAEVDYSKLDEMLDRYKGFNIPLYASSVGFDTLAVAGRFDELQEVINRVRKRVGNFLLGTHYAGVVIPLVEKAGVRVDGYLTPVNSAGIYMFPTRELAEKAVRECGKPVVAIKPLGGGRVPPAEAFPYLFEKMGIPCSMVGIGGMAEAEETLGAAMRILRVSS